MLEKSILLKFMYKSNQNKYIIVEKHLCTYITLHVEYTLKCIMTILSTCSNKIEMYYDNS